MEEILRQVKGAEQEAKSLVEAASREAESMVQAARVASAQLMEQATTEARAAAERMLTERKARVEQQLQAMHEQNQETRRQIFSAAKQHIPEAVALIKERMVRRGGNS